MNADLRSNMLNIGSIITGRQLIQHGLYADLDFHSLKDSTELLQGQEVLLGALVPHEHAQMLPNAWLASAHAGHPFWLFCVAEIIERARANALHPPSVAYIHQSTAWHCAIAISEHWVTSSTKEVIERATAKDVRQVEFVTGPGMLYEALQVYHSVYPDLDGVTILDPSLIYPISWTNPKFEIGNRKACDIRTPETFNSTQCAAEFPDAYAVTYWTHGWRKS
ncbi:hypothetical protein CVIRNUC_009824 [Coccomyxa viridis]|uniref:Uncharacterized protein n=1 Tax=Coccomyxa viridis TaxID=1274662 RepID=A0AAV1IJI8_9CHLO|nr:hypothetical protein CVIRNUC_009824 [Coccomyxa viridis]